MADQVRARRAVRSMDWDRLQLLVQRLAPELASVVAAERMRVEGRVTDIEVPTWTSRQTRVAVPPANRVGILEAAGSVC